MKTFAKVLLSALLAVSACGAALAQDTAPSSSMSSMGNTGGMKMKMMHHAMRGMHPMPATVSSVDTKTGIVEADAEGMSLKLHFPPASVADLKAGDKITLHMGYSKP
jgi:hypothetical protein